MTPNIIDLDHVMIGVESHEKAIAAFERLGFKVRAARPIGPMGGGEAGGAGGSAAVIMLPAAEGLANYLELSYFDEAHGAASMRPILSGVRGGAMLVHAACDAASLHAEWQARGIALHPLIDVPLPPIAGVSEGQRIRVILPADSQPVFCNACEYQSVTEFRDEALMEHANGARRWTGAILTAGRNAMPSMRDHLARIYDMPGTGEGDHIRFSLPTMTVDLMSHALFDHYFPALAQAGDRDGIRAVRVAVEKLAHFEEHLRDAGVRHGRSRDGAITIDGRDGTAIDLIFHEAASPVVLEV